MAYPVGKLNFKSGNFSATLESDTLTANRVIKLPDKDDTIAVLGDIGNITGFVGSVNSTAPNDTVNVSQLLVDVTSTDGNMVLRPKGNGGILVNIPDNTATGGNVRGTGAIDFQFSRTAATQVASGTNAAIYGGSKNTASANDSIVVSGEENSAISAQALVVAGRLNTSSAGNAGVVCGVQNTAGGSRSFVGGGQLNDVQTQDGCILGGNTNLVNGTRAAIVAGRLNEINGGVDNFIGGGDTNIIESGGDGCVIVGGTDNTINTNSPHSMILGGEGNELNQDLGVALGSFCLGEVEGKVCISSGRESVTGDSQAGIHVIRQITNDASSTAITTTSGITTVSTINVGIENSETKMVIAYITARATTSAISKGWEWKALVRTNSGGGGITVIGSPVKNIIASDSGTSTWDTTLSVTGNTIYFSGVGQAATDIKWVGTVLTTDNVYA